MKASINPMIAVGSLLFAVSISACALSGDAISGKVLEASTSKPIKNAIVVAHWDGAVSSLADSQTVCVHVDVTTTDAQGSYRFPAWFKRSKVGPVSDAGPVVNVYKRGYEQVVDESESESIHRLKVFTGNRRERFEYLARQFGAGECDDESAKNALPYLRAIALEAQMIAETPNENRIVHSFIFTIETLALGYEKAEARYLESENAQ